MKNNRNTRSPKSSTKWSTEELNEMVKLGMKREALSQARAILKQEHITTDLFHAAMNAIFPLADKLKPWSKLIEAAHARLPKRSQPSVRFWMLCLHCHTDNLEAAKQFIPRRFDGESRLMELAYGTKILLATGGKREELQKLAKKLPGAIQAAADPTMQVTLMDALAEYFTRTGNWSEALELWHFLQLDEMFFSNGVTGIVEIRVAQALRAIQSGLQLVEKSKKNHDPELETTLPGNEKARLGEAEKEFRRLQKKLEKVLPEERQIELGIVKK